MKALLAAVVILGGCYDSLVSDRCQPGLSWDGVACVPAPGPDAHGKIDAFEVNGDGAGGEGFDARPPIDPVQLVCPLPTVACAGQCIDVSNDPNNCGACGKFCPSGLCENGVCLGDVSGHIVLIGHDYSSHHPAALRLLGDAVDLGIGNPLNVGVWTGAANSGIANRAKDAIDQGMAMVGRMWTPYDLGATPFDNLTGIGTVVILPQRATDGGDALYANGAAWAPKMKAFLARGGVVVVLEGEQDVSAKLLEGAGELTLGAKHVDTSKALTVAASGDPCAVGVLSPYLADQSTVGWDGLVGDVAVVTDPTGGVVAVHATR